MNKAGMTMPTTTQHPVPRLFVALASLLCMAQAPPPQTVTYLSSADLDARTRTLDKGLAVSILPSAPGTLVILARRDRDGEVEIHSKHNDQIFVRNGQATIFVGGMVVGGHEIAPDEIRGIRLAGAHGYEVRAGDSLWIPAGTPHQVKVSPGTSITYVTVKL